MMEMRYYEEGMVKKVVCVFRGWGVQGRWDAVNGVQGFIRAVSARLTDFLFWNGRQTTALLAVRTICDSATSRTCARF